MRKAIEMPNMVTVGSIALRKMYLLKIFFSLIPVARMVVMKSSFVTWRIEDLVMRKYPGMVMITRVTQGRIRCWSTSSMWRIPVYPARTLNMP